MSASDVMYICNDQMAVTIYVKQSKYFAHAITYQHDTKSKINIIYFQFELVQKTQGSAKPVYRNTAHTIFHRF